MARLKSEKLADVAPSSDGVFSISSVLKTVKKKLPDSNVSILQEAGELSGVTVPWWLPTGMLNVDAVLGRGIPGGRLIELYSQTNSEGKTSFLAAVIKAAQKEGYAVLLLDSENGTMLERVTALGVDPNNLLFDCPDTMEAGFSLLDLTIKTIREMDAVVPILVCWDSIGAATTQAEVDEDYDKKSIGLQARVLSSSLKKLMAVLRENKATLICSNQTREKLDFKAYGSETKVSVGGAALKFYAHIRIGLQRIGYIKAGDEITGIKVKVTGKKNKISAPFKSTEISIMIKDGIDLADAELTFAIQKGLVKVAGAWYTFDGSDQKFRKTNYLASKPVGFDQKLSEALNSSTNFISIDDMEAGED